MAELVCPKCLGRMHTVERSGVVFERCVECGGVFLDRGELEQLAWAETTYYRRRPDYDDDDDDGEERRRYGKRRKARHFLEELLDF
jgi:Zn-finger nucleic acid-binding protein